MVNWETSAALVLMVGPVAYLLRSWLLYLITPQGIPGIPKYPDSTPLLDDIPKIAASVKEHDTTCALFDKIGHELGVVAQVRLAGLKT